MDAISDPGKRNRSGTIISVLQSGLTTSDITLSVDDSRYETESIQPVTKIQVFNSQLMQQGDHFVHIVAKCRRIRWSTPNEL